MRREYNNSSSSTPPSPIPSEYQLLNYIEGTGTQYLKLDVIPFTGKHNKFFKPWIL